MEEKDKKIILQIIEQFPYSFEDVKRIYEEVEGEQETVIYILKLSLMIKESPLGILKRLRKGLD